VFRQQSLTGDSTWLQKCVASIVDKIVWQKMLRAYHTAWRCNPRPFCSRIFSSNSLFPSLSELLILWKSKQMYIITLYIEVIETTEEEEEVVYSPNNR